MNLSHLKIRREGLILAWRVDFRLSERYGAPLVFQRSKSGLEKKRQNLFLNITPQIGSLGRSIPLSHTFRFPKGYTHKLEDSHHPVELCKPMNQYRLSHHRNKTYFLCNPNIWQIFNKTFFFFFQKRQGLEGGGRQVQSLFKCERESLSLRAKCVQDRQKRNPGVRVDSAHQAGACLCLFFQKPSKRTVSKQVRNHANVTCLREK